MNIDEKTITNNIQKSESNKSVKGYIYY